MVMITQPPAEFLDIYGAVVDIVQLYTASVFVTNNGKLRR